VLPKDHAQPTPEQIANDRRTDLASDGERDVAPVDRRIAGSPSVEL
jgi:hypothetical protein